MLAAGLTRDAKVYEYGTRVVQVLCGSLAFAESQMSSYRFKLLRIEPDVIRKKGENIMCPRDQRREWDEWG